ncbi:hypothetical protein ACFOY8_13800 [Thalassospira xianhensis]|uniref:Uncharacterized protein n=1 Tax=Thalassospira xianhensis MCCC 1A02616 TaxID=1177929 RepID=A0A367UHF1_9PROT|nr:hypothetical protein [Thalassospira xianhensis]RCK07745.1 hypothetical protein TH5_01475 [Thalassospira xianhensis MCCC 1A02616]
MVDFNRRVDERRSSQHDAVEAQVFVDARFSSQGRVWTERLGMVMKDTNSILSFLGGPTGFEEYIVDAGFVERLLNRIRYKGEDSELVINFESFRYPQCCVGDAAIRDFLMEAKPELFGAPAPSMKP